MSYVEIVRVCVIVTFWAMEGSLRDGGSGGYHALFLLFYFPRCVNDPFVFKQQFIPNCLIRALVAAQQISVNCGVKNSSEDYNSRVSPWVRP